MIKTKKRGLLIVVSAPSGSGKGTIIKELLKKETNCWLSVSTTTREKRDNDIPGETYDFVSVIDFQKKIADGYFLEYTKYADNYYGTPRKFIFDKLEQGRDVILEIEIEGANNIKKLIPEAIFIFIMPPSLQVLKERLEKRGTESKEKILKRFKQAYKEINEVSKYNYVVINDEVDLAVNKIQAIIMAEKLRVDRIEEVFLNSTEESIHEELLSPQKFNNDDIKDKLNEK